MDTTYNENEEVVPPQSLKVQLYNWAHKKANTKKARFWLGAWSFADSSFWPFPADIMLIAMLMSGARRWLYLSLLTIVTSVAGAFLGYLIGFAFFDVFGQALIDTYGLQQEFQVAQGYFQDSAFWALFISAFTPIPYKIFTITAGLFHVHLIPFTIASILGRGLRYILVGYIAHRFGERVLHLALKYFKIATVVALGLIALYLLLLH